MLLIHDDLVRAEVAHRHEVLRREQCRRRLAAAAQAARTVEREIQRTCRWVADAILAGR